MATRKKKSRSKKKPIVRVRKEKAKLRKATSRKRQLAAKKAAETRKRNLLAKKIAEAARLENRALRDYRKKPDSKKLHDRYFSRLTETGKLEKEWSATFTREHRAEAARKGWETRRKNLAQKIEKEREKEKEVEFVSEEPVPSPRMFVPEGTNPDVARKYVHDKLEAFAYLNGYDEAIVNSTILADGTAVVEAVFSVGTEYDDLLMHLSEEIQSWGPFYKVSVGIGFDPSKMANKMELEAPNTARVEYGNHASDFNYYKGMVDVPTNFSNYVVGQFANMRNDIIPNVMEILGGQPPERIRVVVMSGETVMDTKIRRTLPMDLELFDY